VIQVDFGNAVQPLYFKFQLQMKSIDSYETCEYVVISDISTL
jgi:hypothetical protein